MIARRSLIKGLVALVAAPAIVKVASLMPVNAALQPGGISMRVLTEYVPGEAAVQLDVLYGSLKLGNVVTWEAVDRGPLRQFVVIEADGTGTLPKGTQEIVDRWHQSVYDDIVAKSELQADLLWASGEQWGANGLRYNKARRTLEPVPAIPDPLALAAAAVDRGPCNSEDACNA